MFVFKHEYGIFGITDSNSKANELTGRLEAYVDHEYGYGWGGGWGNKIHNDVSEKYGKGAPKDKDIIEMRFDKVNGTLSYKVNETDLGIAFEDIDIEIDYKFAAYMYDKHEESNATRDVETPFTPMSPNVHVAQSHI